MGTNKSHGLCFIKYVVRAFFQHSVACKLYNGGRSRWGVYKFCTTFQLVDEQFFFFFFSHRRAYNYGTRIRNRDKQDVKQLYCMV